MPNILIPIELALPAGRESAKDCNKAELAAAMNVEVDAFGTFLASQPGQDRLVPAERTLLKTYLAWKILHAKNGSST